jgi:hypothetical protein
MSRGGIILQQIVFDPGVVPRSLPGSSSTGRRRWRIGGRERRHRGPDPRGASSISRGTRVSGRPDHAVCAAFPGSRNGACRRTVWSSARPGVEPSSAARPVSSGSGHSNHVAGARSADLTACRPPTMGSTPAGPTPVVSSSVPLPKTV